MEEQQEYSAAIREYKQALSLEPDNADYWAGLNRAFRSKRPDIRRGRTTLTLETQAARIHSDAGDAFAEQQDYDSAIAEYTKAIKLDDETIVWYAKRGNAFFKKEACAEALADYRRVLHTYPQNKEYQDRAAICEEKIKT